MKKNKLINQETKQLPINNDIICNHCNEELDNNNLIVTKIAENVLHQIECENCGTRYNVGVENNNTKKISERLLLLRKYQHQLMIEKLIEEKRIEEEIFFTLMATTKIDDEDIDILKNYESNENEIKGLKKALKEKSLTYMERVKLFK